MSHDLVNDLRAEIAKGHVVLVVVGAGRGTGLLSSDRLKRTLIDLFVDSASSKELSQHLGSFRGRNEAGPKGMQDLASHT